MVFCAVRNNAHRNQNQVTEAFCGSQGQMKGEATEAQTEAFCGSQGQMKGEATEAQQFTPGCGS